MLLPWVETATHIVADGTPGIDVARRAEEFPSGPPSSPRLAMGQVMKKTLKYQRLTESMVNLWRIYDESMVNLW